MGGGGAAAPKAPDPTKTAKAQQKINDAAAEKNQKGSMVNQVTPYGGISYVADPSSPSGYKAVQTLTPEAQSALEASMSVDTATNKLALGQAQKLAGVLDTPLDLNDNAAVEARLTELARKRLDPIMAERRSAMEAKLYNQGVRPGSEAWAREMGGSVGDQDFTGGLTMAENDAYNQLLLTGRGQALEELFAERNQPLKEMSALMGVGQIQDPNFVNAPGYNTTAADRSGIAQNNYLAATSMYNQQAQADASREAAMWGAAGSIAGSFAMPFGGAMAKKYV